jgi:hypothetical protein
MQLILVSQLLPNTIAVAGHSQIKTQLALAVTTNVKGALTLIAAETIYAIVGNTLAVINAAAAQDLLPNLSAAHLTIPPLLAGIITLPVEPALTFFAAHVSNTII